MKFTHNLFSYDEKLAMLSSVAMTDEGKLHFYSTLISKELLCEWSATMPLHACMQRHESKLMKAAGSP